MKNDSSSIDAQSKTAVFLGMIVLIVAIALHISGCKKQDSMPSEAKTTDQAKSESGSQEASEEQDDCPRIEKPDNPEAVALFVNLLSRYADDVTDKTPLDIAIGKSFKDNPNARKTAGRIARKFNRMSVDMRREYFGDLANAADSRQEIPLERYTTAFSKAIKADREPDDVVVEPPPEPPASTTYILEYTGLHCVDESSLDRWSNSDEVYVITSVVTVTPDGENLHRSEKHPLTRSHYGDVDDGESQSGPVAACWAGRLGSLDQRVSLVSTVWEHDDGDPDAYKAEIDAVLGAAAAIVCYVKPPLCGVAITLQPVLKWVIKSVIGSGDDLIADAYRTITKSEFLEYEASPLKKDPDWDSIPYHFYTQHKGGGADYRVLFRCRYEE
jgi:hypothetical protein